MNEINFIIGVIITFLIGLMALSWIIVLISTADNNTGEKDTAISCSSGGFILGLVFCFGFFLFTNRTPPAIEVYRANTTLEITYRDGIAIDSVVVFKKTD